MDGEIDCIAFYSIPISSHRIAYDLISSHLICTMQGLYIPAAARLRDTVWATQTCSMTW